MSTGFHPEALPILRGFLQGQLQECHSRLDREVGLRDESSASSIADLYSCQYDAKLLSAFLMNDYNQTLKALDEYRAHRLRKISESGGDLRRGNDFIPSKEFARVFLTQAAPTKLVDGVWLQHINRIATSKPSLSGILGDLYDIYVEELGAGVRQQNHVTAYLQLLDQIGISMPPSNTRAFVDQEVLFDSAFRVGLIQLGLSKFPEELLPEILGYNLGYEQLPLHLLVTIEELRAIGFDPYYFQLHVTIDNSATGHAHIATQAVTTYLDFVATQQSPDVLISHWKRILAGYALNDIQPCTRDMGLVRGIFKENSHLRLEDAALVLRLTTPSQPRHAVVANFESPGEIDQRRIRRSRVLSLLRKMAPYAANIHPLGTMLCGSSLRRLLSPPDETIATLGDRAFEPCLAALASSEWVVAGKPERSRFLTELCKYGGPMFGVFEKKDQDVITDWILGMSMEDPQQHTSPRNSNAQSFSTDVNSRAYCDLRKAVKDRHELEKMEKLFAARVLKETDKKHLLTLFIEFSDSPHAPPPLRLHLFTTNPFPMGRLQRLLALAAFTFSSLTCLASAVEVDAKMSQRTEVGGQTSGPLSKRLVTSTNGVLQGTKFIIGGSTVNPADYPFTCLLDIQPNFNIPNSINYAETCSGVLIQTTPVPVMLTTAHCGSSGIEPFATVYVGVTSMALGWGYTNVHGDQGVNPTLATSLQGVGLQVVDNTVCENAYFINTAARDGLSCLMGSNVTGIQTSTCLGDSGGAHVYNGVVYGITNFGPLVCDSGEPLVAAKTSHSTSWINGQLAIINAQNSPAIVVTTTQAPPAPTSSSIVPFALSQTANDLTLSLGGIFETTPAAASTIATSAIVPQVTTTLSPLASPLLTAPPNVITRESTSATSSAPVSTASLVSPTVDRVSDKGSTSGASTRAVGFATAGSAFFSLVLAAVL
ncbi:hypothetical protein HDU93_008336 [Gonapodya sp. JEL0774]|nr:hypothetical protein HDU93_008336 [Gonapodya sp. JEL0774]